MTSMRPPQDGHGCEGGWGSAGSVGSAQLVFPASGCAAGTSSRRRAWAVVAAAGAVGVEAVRQDVDQESADELAGSKRHDLLAVATIGAIVFPSEADALLIEG